MLKHSLTLMLSASGALLSTSPLHAQIAPTGSIEGQVLRQEEGSPLPARVWLVGAARPAVANPRGSFRFERLKPGRYHVRATYLGYTPTDSVVSVTSGARLKIVLRLSPTPVLLSDMTIREPAKPPAPIPPKRVVTKPPIDCGLLLILSPKLMLCTSAQALPRKTVARNKNFLGGNSHVRQAAQFAVPQVGWILERELQLDDRTWLITARDPSRPAGLGIVRIEMEETGAHDTTVRIALTSSVFVNEQQQGVRAQAYLARVERILKGAR